MHTPALPACRVPAAHHSSRPLRTGRPCPAWGVRGTCARSRAPVRAVRGCARGHQARGGGGVRTAGRGTALALQTAAPPAPARPAGILICACVRLNICCGPAWLCECTQRATCLELAKRARRRRLDVERWLKFVDELHSQRHAACRSRPRAAVHPATQRRIVQLQHSTHDNVHALSRNHRCPNPQTSSSVPVHSLQHKWGLTFDT